MVRKRYYSRRQNDGDKLIAGISVLILFGLASYFYTNPGKSIAYIFALGFITAAVLLLRKWIIKNHFDSILNKLKDSGQEEYLKNFINRFGLEGRKSQGWTFRNRNFEWDRINDLKKIFREKGIISREKDIFLLLRFYIQEKEEALTRESIHREPQKFARLIGPDFEKLLYRLFEARGYRVELIGRSGDQGGDLIANKNGERVLIQAKCYRDWSTGNAAVQQVVGAMKRYDCNKTMVVTTSYFTPEAITLAKDNSTELISKKQLQEVLLQYLGESWF